MLKNARKKKKMTQMQLSAITGISQSHISKLEQNKFIHSPTIRQVIALSEALEMDPLELAEYFIDKEINSKKN
ncbi:helix-turn-helix domain-containing protein [Paeniclostridium hominis]|uniref:helix-turn-helix domain-containing protein n=1 Tax=Paeniclostridium hominis TaxID=2764329 RepID=UPI0022DEADD8|nr:helix-turn-helix transcriptional regulator [Paeniclostridium hominis]